MGQQNLSIYLLKEGKSPEIAIKPSNYNNVKILG